MKAAFARAPFEVEIREIEDPKPGYNEVLVRIGTCGVCGTDVHIARVLARDFMPLGHEWGGTIAEVGPGVTGFSVGDRVAVENSSPCGHCEACKNIDPDRCDSSISPGGPGMAEYIVAPQQALIKVPDLETHEIALAEPLTVALHVTTTADIPYNSDVIVMGPGPIGLMAVKAARRMGARKVLLAGNSHSKARLALGADLGADEIIEVDKQDLAEAVKKSCPKGVHRAIVTSPPRTIVQAFDLMRYGGVIAFIGIDWGGDSAITFDANAFHFKKLQLRASHAVPNSFFPAALDMIRQRDIDPARFISHRFPLSQAGDAVRTMGTDKETAIKVMVDC